MDNSKISDAERVEMGLSLAQKVNRRQDNELRILIFTAAYFVLDGVTLTIRRLESHLRSRGATVKILSTIPENLPPEQTKDVIEVPGIKIPFNHAGDYSFGIGLDEGTIEQIERYNPNCVHFTVPDFVALDGIRWCQRNNVAYIGTWHSNYVEYLKYYFIEWVLGPGFHRYLKGFFEQIPTVYVPTPYMMSKMRNDWGYGTVTELKLWGRGVDMSIFSPERRSQTLRSAKGIEASDVAILWVGRIVPEKRPDIWMSVVKRLQDEGLPVKAMVVGSGTFERQMSSLKHVACCGWLSGGALGEAYASADILLFPSDVETFGNVTLEALSSGCPAIVERKCGEHLVDHDVCGLTCTSGNAEEFYQATRRLVLDAVERKRMSVAAREKAWKYERNIILQEMAENYKDAIDKHADPAFLKRHMQKPLGAGRNLLSVLCCNFYFIKMIAEPFLNSTRSVQDCVDCTGDCVSMSRSRLSCTDLLVSAAATSSANLAAMGTTGGANGGEATGGASSLEEDTEKYSKEKKKWCGFTPSCSTTAANCGIPRVMHVSTLIISVVLVLLFVYASFTV